MTSCEGAGKLDLYKDSDTGEIVIRPKDNPNAPGEPTGYNIKDIIK